MSRREAALYLVGGVVMAGALLLGVLPAPAMAAKGDTGIGGNLGGEVTSWSKALLMGVATLVGLPALAKREVKETMVIAAMVAILGGFVFADDQAQSVIKSLWKTLAG